MVGFKHWKLTQILWLVVSIGALPLGPGSARADVFGDDSIDDPICFGEAWAHHSQPVARFSHPRIQGCTAFLISPENHVLTARHCLDVDMPAYLPIFFGQLTFGIQADTCGGAAGTPLVVPIENKDVIAENRDLDYVLLKIPDSEPDVAIGRGFGWLDLNPDVRLSQLEEYQEGLWIPAWNIYDNKIMVSTDEQCRIQDATADCTHLVDEWDLHPPDNACIENECDILSTNSGAPTIWFTPYTLNAGVVALVSGGKSARNWFSDIFVNERNLNVKARRIYPEIRQFLPDMRDNDGDGMPNCRDNCPDEPNVGRCSSGKESFVICISNRDCDTSFGAGDGHCADSQLDANHNGVGDACETLWEDDLEQNDTPYDAASVGPGVYSLTLDNAYDDDYYLIDVIADHSDVRVNVSWKSLKTTTLTGYIQYWDSGADYGAGMGPTGTISPYRCSSPLGQGDEYCDSLRYSDEGLVFEQTDVPAGRKYLVHLYGFPTSPLRYWWPLEYEMFVSGSFAGAGDLPEDQYEENDYYYSAVAWDTFHACDDTGTLTIHNNADVDYYKVDAIGDAVEAEISFDTRYGDLQLELCNASLTCTTASDSTLSDTTRTRTIKGCGALPNYIRVQGGQNHYDLCIRKVSAQQGCDQYQGWVPFVGSGSFAFTRTVPGGFGAPDTVVQDTVPLRERMYANLSEETTDHAKWLLVGWIDYPGGRSQLVQGTLRIPRPDGSPASYETYIFPASGLPSWWHDSSLSIGSGTYTGADDAIESFDVADEQMVWSEIHPDEYGFLTMTGSLDTDGDGLSDQLEAATGTDLTAGASWSNGSASCSRKCVTSSASWA